MSIIFSRRNVVAGFPSLLREPAKRFIKYLSVPVASLPAGLIYLFLLKFTTPSIALIVILPIGILSAYGVWALIDRKVLVVSRPSVSECKPQEVEVEIA